mgnify:CR=1 FL=1
MLIIKYWIYVMLKFSEEEVLGMVNKALQGRPILIMLKKSKASNKKIRK